MKLYSTVMGPGQAEQTIERSRFITHVRPVSGREEAEDFFREIRKKYWDATHNVPAMVIGEKFQIQWGSDDGEPQGTSGAPIVQMLVREGVTNVAIVVTRYFGGIKLGTGGLVRAYTSSAKIGLESAEICDVEEMAVLRCKMDYKGFYRVQNDPFQGTAEIRDVEYTDVVRFSTVCQPENKDTVRAILTGLAADSFTVEEEKTELVKMPRKPH